MKNKKAISLIVLVITIIVMAILAATVIITLSNTNIINEVQEAKDKSNEAAEKEALSVALAEWKIIETKGTKTFSEFMQEKYGADKVIVVDENKVTITMESENKYSVAKDGTITKETTAQTVNASKGAFVEYAVSYTDVYNSSNKYTTTNGWRLLDYTDNGDGTYSNVKLISTGIPATLHYDYYNATTNSDWWGTGSTHASAASAGMHNNFKDIKFAYRASNRGSNLGYFTEITSNGITYNSENTTEIEGGNLFIPTGVNAGVSILDLLDINSMLGITDTNKPGAKTDPAGMEGIFVLQNLKNLTSMSSYIYSTGDYWLASEYPYEEYGDGYSDSTSVCCMSVAGEVFGSGADPRGVRPVISITSDIQFTDTNGDGVLEMVW